MYQHPSGAQMKTPETLHVGYRVHIELSLLDDVRDTIDDCKQFDQQFSSFFYFQQLNYPIGTDTYIKKKPSLNKNNITCKLHSNTDTKV